MKRWSYCRGCGHEARGLRVHPATVYTQRMVALMTVCRACEAVLRVRQSLLAGQVQLIESGLTQRAIVRGTRHHVRRGLTLQQVLERIGPQVRRRFTEAEALEGLAELEGQTTLPSIALPTGVVVVFTRFHDWQVPPEAS